MFRCGACGGGKTSAVTTSRRLQDLRQRLQGLENLTTQTPSPQHVATNGAIRGDASQAINILDQLAPLDAPGANLRNAAGTLRDIGDRIDMLLNTARDRQDILTDPETNHGNASLRLPNNDLISALNNLSIVQRDLLARVPENADQIARDLGFGDNATASIEGDNILVINGRRIPIESMEGEDLTTDGNGASTDRDAVAASRHSSLTGPDIGMELSSVPPEAGSAAGPVGAGLSSVRVIAEFCVWGRYEHYSVLDCT